MSHGDFDVVTGPSMPQRRAPSPSQPSGYSDSAAEPPAPRPTPAGGPGETKKSGYERGPSCVGGRGR
jgi:hypothetical protein